MTKLPDPAPASRVNIIVIIAETVSTGDTSREFVTEASSEVGSEARRQRSVTVTLAQTTHLHSQSGRWVLRLLRLLCFSTSHYTWNLFFHTDNIMSYSNVQYIIQVFQQWIHLGKSLLPSLGTSVDMDIRTHTYIQSLNVILKSFQSS